ncbi:MAG: Do family serine endopeptidase [Elusimicrobiota bacterium]
MRNRLLQTVCLVFLVLSLVNTGYPGLAVTENFKTAFTEVSKKVQPSVVNITVEQVMKEAIIVPGYDQDFFRGTPFEDFFRDFSPQGQGAPRGKEYYRRHRGMGTGVIVSKDGYVLTNNHVVQGADKVTVKLSDGRNFTAQIVGSDPKTDLAVIRIKAANLPLASLGDSDKLQVGEWAIALGQPFGLTHTLTAGIISAKGRSGFGAATYEDFIQTDASINPGNSGGPLVNIDGEVIGINTMIIGMGTGIGFAIPINMAKTVMNDLIKHGKVNRPWLGVGIQDLNDELRKHLRTSVEKGTVVNQLMQNSPAGKAGVKVGDIIIKIDQTPVKDSHQLVSEVLKKAIGQKVILEIVRDGKKLQVKLITEALPSEERKPITQSTSSGNNLGIVVQNIKVDRLAPHWFPERIVKGVEVVKVEPGSPAEQSGIEAGDIIQEINRRRITDVQSYKQVIATVNFAQGVLFLISRNGQDFFITIRIE